MHMDTVSGKMRFHFSFVFVIYKYFNILRLIKCVGTQNIFLSNIINFETNFEEYEKK